MPQSRQTRRHFLTTSGATVVGTVGLATTTASAQTDAQQGILADGVGEGGDLRAFILGQIDGLSLGPPEATAATLADRLRNEFNANSSHWINYGNWLIDEYGVTALGDTLIAVDVKVDRWVTDTETVATTIDAGYDTETDTFTSLEWRLGAPDDPDYQAALIDDAAKNGSDELAEFRREFIDTSGEGNHELPSRQYVSRMAGRYSRFVTVGDDGQSVFELLLGEIRN